MSWGARAITSGRLWLLALVVAALPIIWWQVTERAVSAVEIRTLDSASCTGTTIEQQRLAPEQPRVAAILLEPEMSCRLNLQIVNTGRLPVSLDKLVLPLMGPDGGAGVRADSVWIDEEVAVFGEVAAEVILDRWLSADETIEVEIRYGFRAKGCTAKGVLWVPAAQLEPSLLLRSAVVQADRIYFGGTTASSC